MDDEHNPLTGNHQKLSINILWLTGKEHIRDRRDVFSLAFTCRRMWTTLKPEIFAKDIEHARDTETTGGGVGWSSPMEKSSTAQKMYDTREPLSDVPLLHWAIERGHTEMAKQIIDVAQIVWPEYLDTKQGSLLSPIHIATRLGNISIVEKLLQTPCIVNAITTIFDNENKGATYKFDELERLVGLLDDDKFVTYDYKRQGYEIDTLGIAVLCGHTHAVDVLLQHGVDLWMGSNLARTLPAHHIAALNKSEAALRVLLEAGFMKYGYTKSHFRSSRELHLAAARRHNTEIIQLLLDHGADINAQDVFGRTPIIWAACHKSPENIAHLLIAGADATKKSPRKEIPSLLNTMAKDDRMLWLTKLVLDQYANKNCEEVMRAFFASIACCETASETIKYMVEVGVDLHGHYDNTSNAPPWTLCKQRMSATLAVGMVLQRSPGVSSTGRRALGWLLECLGNSRNW